MPLDLTTLADVSLYGTAKLAVMIEGAALCLTNVEKVNGDRVGVYHDSACELPYSEERGVHFQPNDNHEHWIKKERAEQFGLCMALRYTKSVLELTVGKVPKKAREFDYFVHKEDPLVPVAVLEVSGIEEGDTPALGRRTKQKINRLIDRKYEDLPWIVIVAMANPLEMCMVRK